MVCGLRRSLDLLPLWSLLLQSGDEGACPLRSAMAELGLCAHKSAGRPSRTPKAELSGFTVSPDPLGTEGTGQVMETWRISVSISHDVVRKGFMDKTSVLRESALEGFIIARGPGLCHP